MTVIATDGPVFKVVTFVKSDPGTEYQSEPVYDEDEDIPDSLCCLEGCLTGVVAAILFLIVIPAGVILSVYARNTDSPSILAVGIVLIVTPIVCVPVFIAIVHNKRRLKRLRKLGKNQVGNLVEAVPEKF